MITEGICLKYILYRVMRTVFSPIFRILFRPRIIGAQNIPQDGAAVIAGNHKHALDPILIDISTKRVVRTLAKKELHDGRFGFIFRGVGTIPVDLHAASNHSALESAIIALNDGELVNVSPEAKRNYTNELLLPFKFGAAAMSARTGAKIVPYAITGEYKVFSRHRVTVIFGKPIQAQGDITAATKQLYSSVAGLLRKTMPQEELAQKHFTSYDDWSKK